MEQDRSENHVRRAMALGLGLSALALSSGSLGNLSKALNGVLAVVALLGLAVLLFESTAARSSRAARSWRAALPMVLMAITLPVASRGGPWGLLAAALFFLALSRVAPAVGGLLVALSLTGLLFAVYHLLLAYVPAVWYAEQWLALYFSWFVGVGLMLGPTALGLPLVILFGFFALSAFLLAVEPRTEAASLASEGRKAPGHNRRITVVFVLWLAALAAVLAAYIWLQPPLASWLIAHWPAATAPPAAAAPSAAAAPLPTLTYLDFPFLLFMLLWAASALASTKIVPRPLPLMVPGRSAGWAVAGLVTLALATAILTLDPPRTPHRGTILVHDTGHIEWGRPVFGRYGAHSSGAYGLLPDYLAACGYQTRTGPLTGENLENARAVVLISPPQSLSPQEQDRLLAFVKAGGGLVIWGEHTGLGQIREPINDLLARLPGAPIQLKFDSAVPVRQGWAEGLTFLPHPALYGVRDPVDMVIAVGASLAIRPPARPLIVGRFGHSDAGDATNPSRNYVGDMRYNPGERLGDLVLAAEVPYGQGHIVVMGDTTPLGSVNLMTTLAFHARLLDWLTADTSGGWSLVLHNGWLAGLVLLGAGICLMRARSQALLAGALVVLGATLALSTYVNVRTSAPPAPRGPVAYVDISHQERFDRLLWEETSIGGLNYNLVRNGMLPLLLREIDPESLSQAKLLVLVAPGQPFSRDEAETIARWVENGGRLLVSTGWEESEASASLLASFGLQVDNIPLGPAEVVHGASQVRFHEAWPVRSEHEDAQTIVAAYGYPLALYQPSGQGGVILIGDSEFLLGGTLEGEISYQVGNILLLRDILADAFASTAETPASYLQPEGAP